MQAGELISSDVTAFDTRILVNGVERSGKWSVDRQLVGEMPAQVVAVTGFKQATGTIVWAKEQDVSDREIHPWSRTAGWPPKSGDEVKIYAGDGVSEWRQFTGVIDKTTGDVGSGMESSIVDHIDQLNVPFQHRPLMTLMPSAIIDYPYMRLGLNSWTVASRALEASGFPATPPAEAGAVLSMPCQGTIWPEVGTIITADEARYPRFYDAPWGYTVSFIDATVTPTDTRPQTAPVQISLMVGAGHFGDFVIKCSYGTITTNVALRVHPDRAVSVSGDDSFVVSISGNEMAGSTIVTLLVKDGLWTLTNDQGITYSVERTLTGTDAMHRIDLDGGDDIRVAGIMVTHPEPADEFASTEFVPRVRFHGTPLATNMLASPAIVDRTASSVLEEISKATLTGMWIDEHGLINWASSHILRAQTPVQTVTTLDDIFSLSWRDSLLGMRSMVRVKQRSAALNVSRFDNIILYQGSGETLEAGQIKEDFITPPIDEDWVVVNETNNRDKFSINRGRGSLLDGVRTADGETTAWADVYLERSIERINVNTLKLTHEVMPDLPVGESVMLVLRSSEEDTELWPRWSEAPTPMVRGRAKTIWADEYVDSPIRGPVNAPTLEHDLGPWGVGSGTEQTAAERMADYIADMVTRSAPTIEGMRLKFDPRRQLGDVITIVSERLLGIELRALIVGISNSAGDKYEQTVSVRIITATSTYTTYDQLAEAWEGDDYAALDAFWAAKTYTDMADEPLGVT